MRNKYCEFKRKKRSKKSASQGMTAAIILIAFIITAAGIAFVILTMGQEFQLELGNVGNDGKEAASSAMEIEGVVVVGYCNASTGGGGINVTAYVFNVRLVLATGEVDLSESSIALWLTVSNNDEVELTETDYSGGLGYLAQIQGATTNTYDIEFLDGSADVLDPNEIARFYLSTPASNGAPSSTDVVIIINSGVSTMKIEKTIPIGLAQGANLL